ncbi:hypothetical protein SCP_0309890 [Sparassis crispa]|uniref:Uncharacterized protein n=1 Tax=Sparassis crispa TaxID=139825 RepID=A0A401GGG9_9APHY|nr:hypothetical protein SCP_0309890 [Sparassis crispa]GBE81262.1 hypothetical protein SCP_0309890 [Sparassis crispa]
MESKLKALKVVDLKDIIAKANLSIQGKANKQDLINKIIASEAAIDVYNANYSAKKSPSPPKAAPVHKKTDASPQSDEQLNLLEVVDNVLPAEQANEPPSHAGVQSDASVTLSTAPTPPSKTTEIPAASADTPQPEPAAATSPEDEEAAKRKARAERFGIPVVQLDAKPVSPKGNTRGRGAGKANAKVEQPLPDDPEKLSQRTARFGPVEPAPAATSTATRATPKTGATKGAQTNGRKRSAPATETVDAEELERRKKRAERFGIPVVGAKA